MKVTDAQGNAVFRGRRTVQLDFNMYPQEKKFYQAVEEYIRTGYNSLEQIEDGMHRRAIGFILTSFQKLNASSFRAIYSALENRLARLQHKLAELPSEEEEDTDDRYQGEQEEKAALKSDREVLSDEITVLESLLRIRVDKGKEARPFARVAAQSGPGDTGREGSDFYRISPHATIS